MKNTVLGLMMVLGMAASPFVRADCSVPGETLRDLMGEMGRTMKVIGTLLPDPASNPATADHAEALSSLVDRASKHMPGKVQAIEDPASKRLEQLEYRHLMNQLEAATLELQQAVLRNDATHANEAFTRIRALQSAGHERFRG